MSLRSRISLCLALGAASCCLSYWLQTYTSKVPGGDFLWAMRAGAELFNGQDPYARTPGPHMLPYPLPAAFVGFPFSFFPPAIGAGLFFGLSAGVLVFVLTRRHASRPLILLAMPFWFAMVWAQWSPLIMAAAFIPALLPVILIKPQIALPVGLTHWSKSGLYACLAVMAISLAIYPTWPLVWLSQIQAGQHYYQRYFPFLSLPFGPLLLLALLRWREPDARLLFMISLFPQRHFYDSFVLWLIPKSKREIIPTAILSWGAYVWKHLYPTMETQTVGSVSVLFFFLPMLFIILSRQARA